MSRTLKIDNEKHMVTQLSEAANFMRSDLQKGKRFTLEIKAETRGSNLNAYYHSLIAQICDQSLICGFKFSPADGKRLLVDGFRHETQHDPEFAGEWSKFGELRLVPAMNHAGLVAMGEQTRQFSPKLARAFIEWLSAHAADNGVTLMVPKSWEER